MNLATPTLPKKTSVSCVIAFQSSNIQTPLCTCFWCSETNELKNRGTSEVRQQLCYATYESPVPGQLTKTYQNMPIIWTISRNPPSIIIINIITIITITIISIVIIIKVNAVGTLLDPNLSFCVTWHHERDQCIGEVHLPRNDLGVHNLPNASALARLQHAPSCPKPVYPASKHLVKNKSKQQTMVLFSSSDRKNY